VLREAASRYEIILVDDGSRDASWDVVRELAAKDPCVRGIALMRNYGQHNALLCGIRAARNELVVTVDDDLQHPPEEIPKLLDQLSRGFDVVYGAPEREPHQFWRGIASRITKIALQAAMGVETARSVSAFRVFRTQVRAAFESYQNPFVSVDVLLTWGTTRFSAVRVAHRPRAAGESNYTVGKLVRHALNMMTGFSTLPLQIASIVGFAFTGFGIVALVYVVTVRLIQGVSVPGFAFLASLIAIFSGAQLFAIGVIGEYLARIHHRTMDRPAYVTAGEIGASAVSRPDRASIHDTNLSPTGEFNE
jgi:undecaprenyl-phosphate 4-deoxy-4-formamido-L-arabinose transferase